MLNERELIANYPRPIVDAYLRAQKTVTSRGASARDKVTALTILAEVVTKYTAALAIAQYCARGLQDRSMENALNKFARDPARVSFGAWLGLLQHAVQAFQQSGFERDAIVPGSFLQDLHKGELLELYQASQTFVGRYRRTKEQTPAYVVTCYQVLEALLELRNIIVHEQTISDADLAALDYARLLAGLRALLGEMSYLAQYPLVYIEQVSVLGGRKIHDARLAMGAALIARDPFEFDRPLDENRFYIFHPTQDEPLICLGPLLVYVDDEFRIAPDSEQDQLRRVDGLQRRSLFGLIPQTSIDSYRQSIEDAMEGGKISASHQRNLDRLAASLGLPEWLARQIEDEVKQGRAAPPAAAPQTTSPNVDWEYTLDKPIHKIAMSRLAEPRQVWAVVGDEASGDALYLLDGKHPPRLVPDAKSRVETIACAERKNIFAAGYWNGQISIFDEQARRMRTPPNLGNVVKDLVLSSDGSKLAATTWGDYAYLFDLEHDTTLREVALADAGRCIAVSPQVEQVAVGTYHGSVVIFDLHDVKTSEEVGDPIVQVAMTEGHKVIAAHADGRVTSHDESIRRPYQIGGDKVSALAVSRDGHKVVIAYGGRRLTFLSDAGGQLRPAHPSDPELDGDIVHVAISDDGRWCFAATAAGTLYIYEETHINAQWSLGKQPIDLAISADARNLALAFVDGVIRFFTLPTDLVPTVEPRIEVVSVSPSKLVCGKLSVIEILVRNTGDGVAREVNANIIGPIEVKSRPVLGEGLAPDKPGKLEFTVRAAESGTFLLEFEVLYRDDSGGLHSDVTYTTAEGTSRTGTRYSQRFVAE